MPSSAETSPEISLGMHPANERRRYNDFGSLYCQVINRHDVIPWVSARKT